MADAEALEEEQVAPLQGNPSFVVDAAPDREASEKDMEKSSSDGARKSHLGAQRLSKRFSKRLSVSVGAQGKRPSMTSSMTGVSAGRMPVVRLQPTYRLEPKHKFDSDRVGRILQETLARRLASFTYNPKIASLTSKSLSEEFRVRVKEIGFERYKLVVVVAIEEKKGQGLSTASRCLWDPRWDSFASYTHETPQIICTALVFGVFRE